MHRKYIPFDIFPTRCNITHFIYFWKTAPYVSGGISTHRLERTQLYLQYLVHVKPLLLPAATVEEMELVSVWCGNCIDLFWCGCNRNLDAVPPPPGYQPAKSWVHYTTSCNTQSSAPEDGRNHHPKHVELIGIINNPLLLNLVGCLYYLHQ